MLCKKSLPEFFFLQPQQANHWTIIVLKLQQRDHFLTGAVTVELVLVSRS